MHFIIEAPKCARPNLIELKEERQFSNKRWRLQYLISVIDGTTTTCWLKINKEIKP